jgi:hypothetical protein
MAPRKTKSTTTTSARPPAAPAAGSPARQAAPAATGRDPNRLLREAAWSRMFGRIETKNPFTR